MSCGLFWKIQPATQGHKIYTEHNPNDVKYTYLITSRLEEKQVKHFILIITSGRLITFNFFFVYFYESPINFMSIYNCYD